MNARRVGALVVTGLALGMPSGAGAGPAPRPLSHDRSRSDIASTYGGGAFGTWRVDRFALPAYRYTMDQEHDPRAKNVEVDGDTTAWHQVGNDTHHAFASNHGYTQLWSQARLYQWANWYDPQHRHYAGGYGYLNVDGKSLSTLYDDRPAGSTSERDFGVGYAHHRLSTADITVDEHVYAPYGSDPVLLHDVVLTNPTTHAEHVSWFEYWDVNPSILPGFTTMTRPRPRGVAAPTWDARTRTLAVDQLPDNGYADPRTTDTDPLTIFAAALQGPTSAFDTSVDTFFGTGSRAAPAAVTAGTLSNSIAPPSVGAELVAGRTLFAFQAPVTLAPGASVTLRYAYGMAHRPDIEPVLARYRDAADPLVVSERAWASWLPQAAFPPAPWLARELQWDAYMVRSRSAPEEACGNLRTLSQGGVYQYATVPGLQEAFRDPLQHMLPMIYAKPDLARDVLLYSAREQEATTGAIPYAMMPLCTPYYFGGESGDLDLWLLWSAAEYALATRDFAVMETRAPFSDGGDATLWDHLKLAFRHQEQVIGRGAHGLPSAGTLGDWADFSTTAEGLTESTLEAAQLAFVYPRLATVADVRGDRAFAAQLRAAAGSLVDALAREWTGKGWYSRGYAGPQQLGSAQIVSMTQPWAVLAGAPSSGQASTLVANFRRCLSGIGAPRGPAPTGSARQSDPTDAACGGTATSSDSSPDPGDASHSLAAWFALNGPMVLAYGRLDGIVPGAAAYGWEELLRNTLARLATAHPDHWDGIISADDVCDTWWTRPPYRCGVPGGGLPEPQDFDTQILHQPAWGLFSVIAAAGIEPTAAGYRIAPHLPFERFRLRLPNVGVARQPGLLRGYVTPQRSGTLEMEVRVTPRAGQAITAWAAGRRVSHRVVGDLVRFRLPARAGRPADWAVTVRRAGGHSAGRPPRVTRAAGGPATSGRP